MLLAFVISAAVALCAANPLHKYPYVFLLDVGNEELDKTNTEQLRISIPGGSLSMKYPAMGEGEPITHVRVSGIDFGTDLKVNIVEGGPGYRYVVLTFMGNPGVNYDAVVTLQTLQSFPNDKKGFVNVNKTFSKKNPTPSPYEVIAGTSDGNDEDDNESSTPETNRILRIFRPNSYEVSDYSSDDDGKDSVKNTKNMKQFSKKTKEITQASSILYNYAKGDLADRDADEETQNVSSEEHDDNDETEVEDDEDDSDFSNGGQHEYSSEDELDTSDPDERVSDAKKEEHDSDEIVNTKIYRQTDYKKFNDIPRAEQYRSVADPDDADSDKPVDIVDDSLYDKYQVLKPHFGLGYRVYPQSFIYTKPYQVNTGYSKEDPMEFDQMFNDEEVHNDARFKDGSNSIDSDYAVAEY